MAFCRNCGQPIDDNAAVCASCGAAQTVQQAAPQQPVYQQPYGWVPYPYGYIPGQPNMAPNGPQDAGSTKKSEKKKKGSGKVGKFFFSVAMAAVFGTILKLPPLKQALASKQFKSVYLDHLLARQKK